MRHKNGLKIGILFVLLITLLTVISVTGVSAAENTDFAWNLLTDTEAGYRVEDRHNAYEQKTEADGTIYMQNVDNKSGALYIYDDNNILGTYRAFTLEGDFYFESFPSTPPLRDDKYTPEERPLSFLCWIYSDINTGAAKNFNALRIDSQGYLYTSDTVAGKTDVQLQLNTWYNIQCAFVPANGICEVFINGEKAFDFNYTRFNASKVVSGSVRYFDGYYSWSVKMKNLLVKTKSEYSLELVREDAADYLGYQTSKPSGGTFSTRLIFGLNDTEYRKVGYEVYRLETDVEGGIVARQLSDSTCDIYTSIKGGGKDYDVKETFAYNYAAALTVSGLPAEPKRGSFELVVRPYVEGYDGIRRYGISTRISYSGDTDANGYPVFKASDDKVISIVASDDTYIYNGGSTENADNGSKSQLMVRNVGNNSLYRAAYYKFTLDAEEVAALSTATTAKLRVYCSGTESNNSRKPYDMMVYATGTNWTESKLNYNNHTSLAPTKKQLAILPFKTGYYTVDILSYLREQPKNADGSITVSFYFTNVGGSDALVSYFVSKEGEQKPVIEIANSYYNTVLNLDKMGNLGYEPWGYAESIVNEWFDELVDQIYPKDADGNLIYHEIDDFAPEGYNATTATGDFTSVLDWRGGSIWTSTGVANASSFKAERFARTLTTLGRSTGQSFMSSSYGKTVSKYDSYGGISNAGFTGEATGFFHTEVINGRYYIIDPLGNPYFAIGVNTVCLGDSANHKAYSLEKFGSEDGTSGYGCQDQLRRRCC